MCPLDKERHNQETIQDVQNIFCTKRMAALRIDRIGTGEVVRFCLVGVCATLVHYLSYWLLKRWIDVTVAFVTGYVIGFFLNYFLSVILG